MNDQYGKDQICLLYDIDVYTLSPGMWLAWKKLCMQLKINKF